MAKKRKNQAKTTAQTTIDDLVALARQVDLPDDALDDELEDACEIEKQLMIENIKSENLNERLRFLHLHGYELNRLAEIIHEIAAKG